MRKNKEYYWWHVHYKKMKEGNAFDIGSVIVNTETSYFTKASYKDVQAHVSDTKTPCDVVIVSISYIGQATAAQIEGE